MSEEIDLELAIGHLRYRDLLEAKTYMEDYVEEHFKKLGLPVLCVVDYNLSEKGYAKGPVTIELYPRAFKTRMDPRKIEWGVPRYLDSTIIEMENILREKGLVE